MRELGSTIDGGELLMGSLDAKESSELLYSGHPGGAVSRTQVNRVRSEQERRHAAPSLAMPSCTIAFFGNALVYHLA
jgi:hypothetical protein